MTDDLMPARAVERCFRLDDMHVRSEGSGRVVEAYAAVYNVPTEVKDIDGHYLETIDPTAFTRTLQHRGLNIGVLFNHGRTVDGTPAGELTLPIGVPIEVRSDDTGVWTATRYLENPLADGVLEAIKAGALKAQSFSGRFLKSARRWPEGQARSSTLPTIFRQEIAIREYGPAVFAAYDGAAILGTRSAGATVDLGGAFMSQVLALPANKRLEFISQFEGWATPLVDSARDLSGTPQGRAGTSDDSGNHSQGENPIRARILVVKEKMRKKP